MKKNNARVFALHVRKSAFTLIELLVVISIISLLMSLLVPSLRRAMSQAQAVACASRQRQLGITLILYADSQNGLLLPRADPTVSGGRRYWHSRLTTDGYISPDLKDTFICPSHPPGSWRNIGTSYPNRSWDQIGLTFGMRDWIVPGNSTTIFRDKPFSIITSPSMFFLLADSMWYSPGVGIDGMQSYGITYGSNRVTLAAHVRHNSMANVLFADGHVERMDADYFDRLNLTQGEYSNHQPYFAHPDG